MSFRKSTGLRILAALASLACGPLHAADAPTEREFLEAMPMVLTASRLYQPLSEAPVTMTVIDRATIEASGLRDIADLFRLVPGMYVGHGHGIEGIVPVVSYHGLTDEFSRRMQVLIDGRSVYTPLFGTVLWDDLPIAIDDIERIEVTRGPNAASYGDNAFFGAINIITRTPSGSGDSKALARAGQADTNEGMVEIGGAAGRVDYRLTLGHKQEQEFVGVYDKQHHDYAVARADLALTAADTLDLQAGFSEGKRDQGFFSSLVDRPRTKSIDDMFAQMKWRHAFSPAHELSVQFDLQRHGWEEFDQTLPLPLPGLPLQAYFIQGSADTDRYDLEIQDTIEALRDLRVVWGAAARLDRIDAPTYFGGSQDEASNLQRLFAHAEWRVIPGLLLQGGAMLERNSIEGIDVSPRVSATLHLDRQQTLRASVSKAARTPLVYEEHANYGLDFASFRDQLDLATGGVKSEQLVSAELGYHLEPAGRQGNSLDLKVYRDRASRLIDNVDTPSSSSVRGFVSDPQNLYGARVTGIEAEAHAEPSGADRWMLSYAYTVIQSDFADYVVSMPRDLLSVLGEHRFASRWTASGAFYFSSRLQAGGGAGPVAAARRLDLRAAYSRRVFDRPATFAAGVQDVFSRYQDFRPDNVFTRRAYVEISVKP